MEFHKVQISNFKGIDNMELYFRPGINLLLGENGVGKTSILEALTVALSEFFTGINGVSRKGISSAQVRFNTHLAGSASSQKEYFTPTIIQSNIHYENQVGLGYVTRKDETSQTRTSYQGKDLTVYSTKLSNDMNSVLPLLCYFSTQRLAQPKREDFGTASKNELNDRRCGYIGCLDDNLDRKALEAWCLKMEMAVFKQMTPVREYEVFKEVVSNFMMHMNGLDEPPIIDYSRRFDEMEYVENGVATPIKYLSAGYQSLLWIIMTIGFRLCQLNPNIENYKDVPGVVLIDEIDMHLHPMWQWKIVDALQNTFPKVQFVLATHAPIIISSSKNAHLIHIDNNQSVSYPASAYAVPIDDVATYTQGSAGIPDSLNKQLKDFYEAYQNGDKAAATEIYNIMLEQFGENNSEVDLARRRLRIM